MKASGSSARPLEPTGPGLDGPPGAVWTGEGPDARSCPSVRSKEWAHQFVRPAIKPDAWGLTAQDRRLLGQIADKLGPVGRAEWDEAFAGWTAAAAQPLNSARLWLTVSGHHRDALDVTDRRAAAVIDRAMARHLTTFDRNPDAIELADDLFKRAEAGFRVLAPGLALETLAERAVLRIDHGIAERSLDETLDLLFNASDANLRYEAHITRQVGILRILAARLAFEHALVDRARRFAEDALDAAFNHHHAAVVYQAMLVLAQLPRTPNERESEVMHYLELARAERLREPAAANDEDLATEAAEWVRFGDPMMAHQILREDVENGNDIGPCVTAIARDLGLDDIVRRGLEFSLGQALNRLEAADDEPAITIDRLRIELGEVYAELAAVAIRRREPEAERYFAEQVVATVAPSGHEWKTVDTLVRAAVLLGTESELPTALLKLVVQREQEAAHAERVHGIDHDDTHAAWVDAYLAARDATAWAQAHGDATAVATLKLFQDRCERATKRCIDRMGLFDQR